MTLIPVIPLIFVLLTSPAHSVRSFDRDFEDGLRPTFDLAAIEVLQGHSPEKFLPPPLPDYDLGKILDLPPRPEASIEKVTASDEIASPAHVHGSVCDVHSSKFAVDSLDLQLNSSQLVAKHRIINGSSVYKLASDVVFAGRLLSSGPLITDHATSYHVAKLMHDTEAKYLKLGERVSHNSIHLRKNWSKLNHTIITTDENATLTNVFFTDIHADTLNVATGVDIDEIQGQGTSLKETLSLLNSLKLPLGPVNVSGKLTFEQGFDVQDKMETRLNPLSDFDLSMAFDTSRHDSLDTEIVFRSPLVAQNLQLNSFDFEEDFVFLADDKVTSLDVAFDTVQVTQLNLESNKIGPLDLQENFLMADEAQQEAQHLIFNGTVNFDSEISSRIINGLNPEDFMEMFFTLSPNSTLPPLDFKSDVVIEDSLFTSGRINGLSIPDHLFYLETHENISNRFDFANVTAEGAVQVDATVNSLHLPYDIVTLDGSEVINSNLVFSSGLVSDESISLSKLLVNHNFSELSMAFEEVQKVDLSQEKYSSVMKRHVIVQKNLTVLGNVNTMNLGEISEDIVLSQEPSNLQQFHFTGTKTFHNLFTLECFIDRVNDVSFSDLARLADASHFESPLHFEQIQFANVTSFDTKDDLFAISSLAQRKHMDSVLDSYESDESDSFSQLHFINVRVDGRIDNISPEDLVLASSAQPIGSKSFSGNVSMPHLQVNELQVSNMLAGVNIPDLLKKRITLSTPQILEKKHVELAGNPFVRNLTADRINSKPVDALLGDIVTVHGSHQIRGFHQFAQVNLIGSASLTTSLIPDAIEANVESHLLRPLAFSDLTVTGDITITDGFIRGFAMDDFLWKNSSESQTIASETVTFKRPLTLQGNLMGDKLAGLHDRSRGFKVLLKTRDQTVPRALKLRSATFNGNFSTWASSGRFNPPSILEQIINIRNPCPASASVHSADALMLMGDVSLRKIKFSKFYSHKWKDLVSSVVISNSNSPVRIDTPLTFSSADTHRFHGSVDCEKCTVNGLLSGTDHLFLSSLPLGSSAHNITFAQDVHMTSANIQSINNFTEFDRERREDSPIPNMYEQSATPPYNTDEVTVLGDLKVARINNQLVNEVVPLGQVDLNNVTFDRDSHIRIGNLQVDGDITYQSRFADSLISHNLDSIKDYVDAAASLNYSVFPRDIQLLDHWKDMASNDLLVRLDKDSIYLLIEVQKIDSCNYWQCFLFNDASPYLTHKPNKAHIFGVQDADCTGLPSDSLNEEVSPELGDEVIAEHQLDVDSKTFVFRLFKRSLTVHHLNFQRELIHLVTRAFPECSNFKQIAAFQSGNHLYAIITGSQTLLIKLLNQNNFNCQ